MHLTLASPRGRLVLIATILGSAMPFVDGTAVNVALPAMAAEFGATFAGFQWILNAYLITLSALVLPGGAISDRIGGRGVLCRIPGGGAGECTRAPARTRLAGRVSREGESERRSSGTILFAALTAFIDYASVRHVP
ncbi:MAG: hypothetical protein RQ745_06420 [Longimicrobiales bacterium]|nr:hypothetical protein [Longimicrobiales bacterium]